MVLKSLRRASRLILPATLLAAVLGCGASASSFPAGKLSGKVAYKKQTIKIGNVSVTGADGKGMAQGVINADGTYYIDKAPAGKVKIRISFPDLPDDLKQKRDGAATGAPPPPAKQSLPGPELSPEHLERMKSIVNLPAKILQTNDYEFNTEVKEGQANTFDLLLDKLLPF